MSQPLASPSSAEQEAAEFIERFATMISNSGWPRMMARVFAALMAAEDGRRTAQELREILQVGAPAISGAIKTLVQLQFIDRQRVPGDRREFYKVREDAWYRATTGNDQTLALWQEAASEGAKVFGKDTGAGRRFSETEEFFAFIRAELPKLMERWHDMHGGDR